MPEFALPAAVAFAAFVVGVLFSTKIKDWLQGVPSELRSHLNDLETSIKAQVKAASAAVVADVKAKVLPATPVLQTSVVASVAAPAAPVTATVTGLTKAGVEPPHA